MSSYQRNMLNITEAEIQEVITSMPESEKQELNITDPVLIPTESTNPGTPVEKPVEPPVSQY